MIWPPSILCIRIADKRRKGSGLWLPVFLLWPLIGLAAVISPAILTASSRFRNRFGAKRILVSGPWLLLTFCRLRGLKVDVRSGCDRVYIAFI